MAFDFEKQNENWEAQNSNKATWPKGLLVFVFVLLFLAIGIKVGIDFLNKNQEALIKKYDDQVKIAKNNFPVENQNAVLAFEKSVKNVKLILENKVRTSAFLTSIANNTHKDIYFTYLNSDIKGNNVEIGGVAKSLVVISQAASAFSGISGVENVEIKNIRNSGSNVTFILNLIVKDSFFK